MRIDDVGYQMGSLRVSCSSFSDNEVTSLCGFVAFF